MSTKTADTTKIPRGHVRCERCGKTEKIDRRHVANYGWPQCCSLPMKPSKKPIKRYEVTFRPGPRPHWHITQYASEFTAISHGDFNTRPDDDDPDEEIIRRARLVHLTVPVYVERPES